MVRYFYTLFMILCVMLSSCGTEKNYVYDTQYIEFSAPENGFVDSAYLSDMEIVVLENIENESVINNITKILYVDSMLYIFDKSINLIRVFNKHGKYVQTINHMGHGKGEYVHLIDVTTDSKNKELLCLVDPSSIIHYSWSGNYLRTEKLDGYYTDICCDESYVYLYRSTYANAQTPEYTITCINKDDGKQTELLAFHEEYAPFCSVGNKLFANGTGVSFVRKFDDNIYYVSNAQIDSCYTMRMNSFQFPKDKLSKKYDCGEIYDICQKNKYIYVLSNIVQGKNNFMFSSNLFDIHIALPDKGICKNYSHMKVSKYNLPVSRFVPIEGKRYSCCFIMNSTSVMNFKKMYERNSSVRKTLNANFFNDMKDITDESNPVLFIYNFK